MTRQTVTQSMKSIAGALLLAVGLLLLSVNLDAVGTSLTEGIGPRAPEGMDTLLAVGLATIHAAQSYTFERTQFVSGVRQILVSFWPLTLVVFGTLLLRAALSRFVFSCSTNLGSFSDGEGS